MTSVDYFEIDDKEYMITNEIEDNNLIYYFLSNLDEKEDIMIRKTKKDDPSILYPLDNVDEVGLRPVPTWRIISPMASRATSG